MKECGKSLQLLQTSPRKQPWTNAHRQVWTQNTKPEYQDGLDEIPKCRTEVWTWSVAPGARPDDLLLMYRAGNKSDAKRYGVNEDLLQSIANICIVKSFPKKRKKFGHDAEVVQIAILKNPLRLEQMRKDKILKSAPFVLKSMFGRNNVTPYWYRLYDIIIKLNPYKDIENALKPYQPEIL